MAAEGQKTGGKAWPKVHLIYFALAAFDLIAVAAGLYLSHHLGQIIERSAQSSRVWQGNYEAVWALQADAGAINEPANDIYHSHDPAKERSRLDAAVKSFDQHLATARAAIEGSAPDLVGSQPLRTLAYVDQASRVPADWAKQAIARFEAGDIMAATEATSQHDRAITILRQRISEAVQAVRGINEAYQARYLAQAERLKSYEWLIGGWIAAMVLGVLAYGFYVGRLMRRKYGELEAAHDELHAAQAESAAHAAEMEKVNADVSRLNVDLNANLQRLKEAQDEIVRKSKMAQLGQLTATVAHELRNPLGAVKTSAFLLGRKVKDKGLGVEPQLQRIDSGISRCDNIITQLLDFSRTKQLALEPVDFDKWLASALEEQAAGISASIAIECELGLGGLKAPIDLPRMQRVVVNLMANAAEALSRKSDGTPVALGREPRITVTTRPTKAGIVFTVADNGPGITAANMARIREPLFTTKNFGTGLGIPAIEQIVAQHGGSLDIESEEGKGASFTIWLPAEVPTLRAAS